MPPRSKVLRFPPDVREAIAERYRAGMAYEEIARLVRGQGYQTSSSSLYRYMSSQKIIQNHIRYSQEFAEKLVSTLGRGGSDGKLVRSVTHIIASLTQIAAGKKFERLDEDLDMKDLDALARIVRNLATASKQDVSRENELADLLKKQSGKLKKAASAKELEPEAAKIACRILGLPE